MIVFLVDEFAKNAVIKGLLKCKKKQSNVADVGFPLWIPYIQQINIIN